MEDTPPHLDSPNGRRASGRYQKRPHGQRDSEAGGGKTGKYGKTERQTWDSPETPMEMDSPDYYHYDEARRDARRRIHSPESPAVNYR